MPEPVFHNAVACSCRPGSCPRRCRPSRPLIVKRIAPEGAELAISLARPEGSGLAVQPGHRVEHAGAATVARPVPGNAFFTPWASVPLLTVVPPPQLLPVVAMVTAPLPFIASAVETPPPMLPGPLKVQFWLPLIVTEPGRTAWPTFTVVLGLVLSKVTLSAATK